MHCPQTLDSMYFQFRYIFQLDYGYNITYTSTKGLIQVSLYIVCSITLELKTMPFI